MGEDGWAAWLGEHAWVVWVVISLALAGVEIMTLDLVFLMLAAGAVAGAGAAAVGAGAVFQIIAAAIASVAMLGFVRPVALRHLRYTPSIRTGVAALVGRQAVVLERVDCTDGRVKLGGEVWSARPLDPDRVIEPGKTVEVVEIDGATAVVYETGY